MTERRFLQPWTSRRLGRNQGSLGGRKGIQGTAVEHSRQPLRAAPRDIGLVPCTSSSLVLQRRERADRLSAPVIDFMSVGFGRRSFLCDVARELQRAVGGCATLHLPDGLMVSSRKPSLRDGPSPGATPCRGLFFAAVGFAILGNLFIWATSLDLSKFGHLAV
jgi:hypothetical protein